MKKIEKKEAKGTTMKEKQDDAIAQLKAKSKPEAAPAAEAKETAAVTTEQSKTAEPAALTLPEMTAHFCVQDIEHWNGQDDIYDPQSHTCIACLAAFPEQPAICAARTAYLQSITGKKKKSAVKKERAKAVRADGVPNQTDLINGLLKASTPLEEIVTALATAHYGGSTQTASGRIARHIKSILTGDCKSSTEMKPHVAYLTPKPATAPAPAA